MTVLIYLFVTHGLSFFGWGTKQAIFMLVVRANFVGHEKKKKSCPKICTTKIMQLISTHLERKTGYEAGTGIFRLFSKASNTVFSRHIKPGCNLPVCITTGSPFDVRIALNFTPHRQPASVRESLGFFLMGTSISSSCWRILEPRKQALEALRVEGAERHRYWLPTWWPRAQCLTRPLLEDAFLLTVV